jgi:transcriptional regulator with PAS, ATPase and Fis domain
MLDEIANVAKSDLPVLVLGESGTGKELIASGVHDLSGRTGQFVAVNCSAIPATMLEDEFFGHMHGAFTSAAGDKMGLLELAHEGSVFMDEVGEMSLDLQAKLLRFLETHEFRRIGGTKNIRVNTRIVAATNRDREKMQNGDGFRSDLYYRLAHAVYTLPPLRQRGDDVELLVEHFLDLFCEQHHKHVLLSTSARERLLLNNWPGNVRQLRSVMQKIVISAPDEHVITPRELPVSDVETAPRGLDEELMDQERRRIVDALERTHYVKADAARMLRMSRTSMLAKMKRLGIPG